MEYESQPAQPTLEEELEFFDFRVRISYYDRQQELIHNYINDTSHEKNNVRTIDELASRIGQRDARAKLAHKVIFARSAALRCREYDPMGGLQGFEDWVVHHYDYLASQTLLEDDTLDYEALHTALMEEQFNYHAAREAREHFEHFLRIEF